jgi:hypothetical protein
MLDLTTNLDNDKINGLDNNILNGLDNNILDSLDIEDISPEICLAAVKNNINAFKYLAKNILLNNYSYFANEMKHTKEISLIAVNCFGIVLRNLNNQSFEICKEAIKNNPEAFEFVKNKNFKICQYALNIDGMLIKHINLDTFDNNKKDTLIKTALSQNGLAIQFINQTPEYCKIAFQNNDKSFNLINLKIKSPFIDTNYIEDDCAICLGNSNEKWCQLNCCTHKFHFNCIKKINQNSCPLCREKFIIDFI